MKFQLHLVLLNLALASLTHAAEFDSVKILPRQDWASRIYDYRIEVSNDAAAWTAVATGTMAATSEEKTIAVAKQSARYVRVVVLTTDSQNGAAIGEFNLLLAGATLSREEWAAAADSEAPEAGLLYGPAHYAIDGVVTTCWHTAWPHGESPLPHTLTIDTQGAITGSEITLEWQANDEPPVITGYAIAYGQSPTQLDKSKTVGKVTECTLTDLTPGVWYFAARATSSTGVNGQYCAPITQKFIAAPGPAPSQVKSLRVRRAGAANK